MARSTSMRPGPVTPIGATSQPGVRAPGSTAGMPIAAPIPAARKVHWAPARSTNTPPITVPRRTENRIVPPISDMARPRKATGIRRVRSACRDNITASELPPNTRWAAPSTSGRGVDAITVAVTTMAPSEAAPTRAGPQRSVAHPTGRAKAAAPAPPAPATRAANA